MSCPCYFARTYETGAQTAFVRVGQAFAALKTPSGRDESWREVVSGHGWLPPTTVPGAGAAYTTKPLEQSAVGLRAEGEALVVELRRWKEEWAEGVYAANNNHHHHRQNSPGDANASFRSVPGSGPGGIANLTRNEPSGAVGLSPAEMAPMLSGAIFTVREKGRVDVKPRSCSLWLGRQKPHVLNYRWVSSAGHQPDGSWLLARDVVRVGRMRPASGGEGASWSLALTDGTTMVMTASSPEVADIWVSNLKVLLGGGGGGVSDDAGGASGIGGGGGGGRVGGQLRSFVPMSPVSPPRTTGGNDRSRQGIAFGTARTLTY